MGMNSIHFFQYDLELVFVKNSHEFVHEYMKKPEYVELMRRLGALGDGNQDQSKFHALFFFFPAFNWSLVFTHSCTFIFNLKSWSCCLCYLHIFKYCYLFLLCDV